MSPNWPEKYKHHPTPDNPEERQELDLLHKYSELDYKSVNVDKGWDRICSRIKQDRATVSYAIYWRVAAIILLVGGLSFVAYQVGVFTPESTLVEVTTGAYTKSYQLPDGSVITLDDDSKFSYIAEDFKENRNISFEGEAFFEIAKDKNSTFTITTPGATVRVLGTSFNLETAEDTRLFVKTGLVAFETNNDMTNVSAGEYATATQSGKISVKQNTDPNVLSWKTGVFIFDNTNIQEAFTSLSKYYDVSFTANQDLMDCTITASFEKKSLKEVVNVISTILNAKTSLTREEVNFTGTGCK